MLNSAKLNGLAIATAAAGLFLLGCANADMKKDEMSAEANIKCAGVNSCKGTSECKSASNDCKGHNSCKGHGWLSLTEEQCAAQGGAVI